MSTTNRSRWAVEAPPEAPVWDPLIHPYLSGACRAARHQECRRGMDYYPQGLAGEKIDIRCACAHVSCPCSAAR